MQFTTPDVIYDDSGTRSIMIDRSYNRSWLFFVSSSLEFNDSIVIILLCFAPEKPSVPIDRKHKHYKEWGTIASECSAALLIVIYATIIVIPRDTLEADSNHLWTLVSSQSPPPPPPSSSFMDHWLMSPEPFISDCTGLLLLKAVHRIVKIQVCRSAHREDRYSSLAFDRVSIFRTLFPLGNIVPGNKI